MVDPTRPDSGEEWVQTHGNAALAVSTAKQTNKQPADLMSKTYINYTN